MIETESRSVWGLVVFLALFLVQVCMHFPVAAADSSHYLDELDRALSDRPSDSIQSGATPGENPSAIGDIPLRAMNPLPVDSTQPAGLTPAVRIRVTAQRHTILSSQSAGRIEEIAVRDGDRFVKDQLLVRLDSTLLNHQLERTNAAFKRQELLYRMTKELGELQSKGEIEVEVSRLEMAQVRADLMVMEKMLSRTLVTAPFSGRVAEVFAREKQFVNEGHPLMEILDDSTLELEFIVSSKWIRWFAPGYKFIVKVEETGREHQAVLERLGGKVDPLSQSMKAYATIIDPTPDLMEGMSGEAKITPPPGVEP